MEMIGIKELQTNPAILTKSLEKKEITLITKRGKPIGIAINFDDRVVESGLKTSLLIKAYEHGDLSLGEIAKSLNLSKRKTMKLLSAMGVAVIDYDLKDDLDLIRELDDRK